MKRFLYGERDYTFGEAMLTLRTALGLTQAGLAEHLSISRRAVAEWEAGSSYPKAEHLKQLIALGVRQQAFPTGREVEEIRALWRAARQKVLLDESWLVALLSQQHPPLALMAPLPVEQTSGTDHVLAPPAGGPRVDWGDALDVPTFYGRKPELAALCQWVVQERCCVVSVLGMGGIGKSALAVSLMHQLAPRFEVVLWRSLRDAPACEALLEDCLQVLARSHRWVGRQLPTWVRCVAWSPDGTRLVGGGDDGHVYLWDAADGTLLLAGHHGMVASVAWSRDGRRLASGGGGQGGGGSGELLVWDVQSGECVQAFAGHPGVVYAIAWDPCGDLLVSGGSDGVLRWWDVQSGECMRMRAAHQGAIRSLRSSPDGSRLVSCGSDGAIIVWDLASGEHLQTLRRDRPYERLDITGIRGVTEAQKATLRALGAMEDSAVNITRQAP